MSGVSVATIREPEFINITSISPLISKCEIKVLYVGQNRNKSFITKEVATNMAQSLPGTPIVGRFIENKEDFGDHGDQMIIDSEGVKFKSLTQPYGFVAPNAKIWFQEFEDTDEFGNVEIREYLMTEGFLWTEQYKECKRAVEYGNPHSMELDKETLKGHWSTEKNSGVEFFIINDALFSKLCILGEDVEPCFEGSSITAPKISANFSKDTDTIFRSLSDMMRELKFALQGGELQEMPENMLDNVSVVENLAEDVVIENPVDEEQKNSLENQDKTDEINIAENQNNTEEFAKKEDEEKDNKDKEDDKSSDKPSDDNKDEDDEDKKDKKNNFSLEDYNALQAKVSELTNKFSALEAECESLRQYRNSIEDAKKDELIASFCMLSDEDKQDVISNKAKYSLEDIEAKLSVICYRKKINFNLAEETEKEESNVITYNLNETESSTVPAWIKAVRATKERNK